MELVCNIDSDEIVNGSKLMYGQGYLVSWYSPLNKLQNGTSMFQYCENLKNVDTQSYNSSENTSLYFPSLEYGDYMFSGCHNLEIEQNWNNSFPSLISGNDMFSGCHKMQYLPWLSYKLENGCNMFKDCENLKYARCYFPSLKDGTCMFQNCKNLSELDTFRFNELQKGEGMFYGCCLSVDSTEKLITHLYYENVGANTTSEAVDITLGCENAVGTNSKIKELIGVSGDFPSFGQIYPLKGGTIIFQIYYALANGEYDNGAYDVISVNGYIPDASSWNEEVYMNNDLKIVRVLGGTAYDG